jgi:hypothetical protein
MISRRQILKSIGLALLGATPGFIMWARSGSTQGLVLCALGTFIGFAFSLPGVSASRVAGLTAGVIIANNVPGPLKHKVMDHFDRDSDGPPPEPPKQGETDGASRSDRHDRAR